MESVHNHLNQVLGRFRRCWVVPTVVIEEVCEKVDAEVYDRVDDEV